MKIAADNPEPGLSRGIAGLLLAALMVRLALVWGGGQYFWPDESRYIAAQEALNVMMGGQVKAGLTSLVASGDHVGFKLLSLLPAAMERFLGVQDLRLAAGFFALLSWTGLIWLWRWARRVGASPAAQAWTVLLAVTSTSLTFYARHLLPYDPALALALAALWVGAKAPASGPRLYAAGALAGCAVMVYFGYWLLGGVVLVLLALGRNETWGRRLVRGGAAGLGFASVLLGVWLIDRWGEGTMIANARKFSATITQGDFGQGYRLVWEYFWHTEGLVVLLWLGAAVYATRQVWRDWRGAQRLPPAWGLVVLALGLIYAGLVLFSDVVPKFVVYGRTARQLAPFFCLAGGLALVDWLARRSRQAGWIISGALVINAAWHLGPALTQMFPGEFKRAGVALLAAAPPAEPGRSYYRFVNVEHYLYEPEVLAQPPEATLLARRHPYEFTPYLYEGSTAQQRARRRAVDHRMQLVRLRIPETWLVRGGDQGMITMKVRFASGRGGMAEPLLSAGPRNQGYLVFVRYLDEHQLVLGMESVGVTLLTSEPLAYEAGREYELEFFTGSLLPPVAATDGSGEESRRLYYQNLVSVRWNGREILSRLMAPRPVNPGEIYGGYNFVHADSADTAFSGTIQSVIRGGYPSLPAGSLANAAHGAVRMVLGLPVAPGAPEPLLVVGVEGHATLGYVRVMSAGRLKLGAEFWGYGAFESEEVAAALDKPAEVIFHFPTLYPPVGDPRWGNVDRATQEARRSRLTILLNDTVVLDQEVKPTGAPSGPVAFGRNPVGGSWVTEKFTGQLVQVMRLPLAGQ